MMLDDDEVWKKFVGLLVSEETERGGGTGEGVMMRGKESLGLGFETLFKTLVYTDQLTNCERQGENDKEVDMGCRPRKMYGDDKKVADLTCGAT